MMRIRTALAVAVILISAAGSLLAQTPAVNENSCRKFVQGFYAWYVPKALHEGGSSSVDTALRTKPRAFAPELYRLLKADSAAQAKAKGEIVGLDFDPFLNTQDPSAKYEPGAIKWNGKTYLVEIYSVRSGNRAKEPDVTAEVMPKSGQCIFIDFHYPKREGSKEGSLIQVLKELARYRDKNPT